MHIYLEALRHAASHHPAVGLENLLVRRAEVGDDLGQSFPDHILQPRQGSESGVHLEVDKVERTAWLRHHPAIGQAVHHIREQRTVARRALAQGLLRSVGRGAGLALGRELRLQEPLVALPPEQRHGRGRHRQQCHRHCGRAERVPPQRRVQLRCGHLRHHQPRGIRHGEHRRHHPYAPVIYAFQQTALTAQSHRRRQPRFIQATP